MNTPRAVDKLGVVIDAWCERRALKPLSKLLPGWLAVNGLTDGWEILRQSLRHTRAMCREELTVEELTIIARAIAEIDQSLDR
ncbi:MAG: hypothetical protein ACYC26_10370 [Phycisphaerales bacterium]